MKSKLWICEKWKECKNKNCSHRFKHPIGLHCKKNTLCGGKCIPFHPEGEKKSFNNCLFGKNCKQVYDTRECSDCKKWKPKPAERNCEWKEDDIHWNTSCQASFVFENGGVKENGE